MKKMKNTFILLTLVAGAAWTGVTMPVSKSVEMEFEKIRKEVIMWEDKLEEKIITNKARCLFKKYKTLCRTTTVLPLQALRNTIIFARKTGDKMRRRKDDTKLKKVTRKLNNFRGAVKRFFK